MSNSTLKMKNETALVTVPSQSLGMKALPKILLALTAVAALSVAHPAKANLITNAGFEQGSNGWTIFPSIGLGGTQNGISPHSGNLQVYTVGNFPGAGVGQTLATRTGATYTVSFFLAAAGATGGTLDVLWGGSTVFSHVFNSLSGYTPYTFNVTASNASTALRFSFGGRGQQFLDDISVTPAGVPDGGSTVSLLGCALLGVAVLRRKLRC